MTNILAYPFYNNSPKASRAESTDDECSRDSSLQKTYKTNIIKYKTEICKNYSEMGYCPYRDKCQFAHGEDELHRTGPLPKKAYRTKKCKSFWEEGTCRYGFRCQFLHNHDETHSNSDLIQKASLLLGSMQPLGKSKLSCIFEEEVN